jgi:hypothetical protein
LNAARSDGWFLLSVEIHSCRFKAHSPHTKCPSASTTSKRVETTTHYHTPNLKTTPLPWHIVPGQARQLAILCMLHI